MATIVTRSGKGSPLTNTEVDANFSNLNADKAELDGAAFTGAITTNSTIDGRDVAADGVTADAALPKAGGAMTGAITTNSTFDGVDVGARDAVLTSTTTTANAALPKAGGAVTGAITTNSTFDGVDVGARDSVLSSTTTAANAALPKAGGAMTGAITTNSTFDGRDVAADGVTADAALPKAGGAMTGAITTNSTFDGVDVGTRDAVLTSTTTTANAALPKSGGTMTGALIVNETSAVTMSKGTTGQRPSGVSGMFRYNTTEDKFEGYSTEWGEIGGGAADLRVNSFTGNGSTTAYTLSSSPDLSNTLAYIDGVYQVKAAYSMSGQTLTFSAAPDNGSLIEITAATVAPVQESTDFLLNQFSGNGSTTAFSLSAAPTTENQCSVFISGVYQSKSNFSVSGSTLTFSTAPPSGSAIEVMAARTVVFSAGTPDDGTVTTAKIANGAVTAVKLADDAVTTDKLANNVVINTSGAITGAAGSFTTLSASGTVTATSASGTAVIALDDSRSNVGDTTSLDFRHNGITGSLVKSSAVEDFSVSANRSSDLQFWTRNNGSQIQAITINSTGNVGFGVSSPAYKIDATTTSGGNGIKMARGSGSFFEQFQSTSGGVSLAASGSGAFLALRTGTSAGTTTERTRVDKDGYFIVGASAQGSLSAATISQAGYIQCRVDGAPAAYFDRQSSDGSIVEFRKAGSAVGSVSTFSGKLTINSTGSNLSFQVGGTTYINMDSSRLYPQTDNSYDLGIASNRFDDIFATNGTIQTSDRNEKQDIAELSDAEQRVAVACKGLLRKFRWKDSVAEKGDDARTHFGIIAQDLQAAFVAEGLDAGDYAMFISTTWTDEETNEEKTRMGVRYSELLAFIISAI